ncbi:MAG: hypothetical protein LIP02_03100 [Bacteroidales bacterium]|nr:hypothetical protein [Bacteroidales bacterium]
MPNDFTILALDKWVTKTKSEMIVVESKRKKIENLRKAYPGADIIDVTSHAEGQFQKFSPFYPHGDIPVPFTEGTVGASVEGIWQGLKVFESEGCSLATIKNNTMKDLKRTVRKYGPCRGHRKGLGGMELLDYIEARKQIYLPTYRWVLEHKIPGLVKYLRRKSEEGQTIVLLDYETNGDVNDPKKPLSHAQLIKMMVDGTYPEY